MKRILIPMLLGLSVLTLGAARSVPVKHWEFDYYNYSISGGQETLYLNLTMALRYNFDTPPVDVGGEVTVGPSVSLTFGGGRKE